jgi:hypothetical protein
MASTLVSVESVEDVVLLFLLNVALVNLEFEVSEASVESSDYGYKFLSNNVRVGTGQYNEWI